jgi:MFS family permease
MADRSAGSPPLVTFPVLLGPILGPFVGGLIVQHLSWRWIFWVNVPFCVVGLILAWRLMPSQQAQGTSGSGRMVGLGTHKAAALG